MTDFDEIEALLRDLNGSLDDSAAPSAPYDPFGGTPSSTPKTSSPSFSMPKPGVSSIGIPQSGKSYLGNKKALIIGKKGEFLLEGISNDLRLRGFTIEVAPPVVSEVAKTDPEISIGLLIADLSTITNDFLAYIKDRIFDKHMHLFIMCHKQEQDEICKAIPKDELSGIFLHPVNIREIGAELSDTYDRTMGEGRKKSVLIVDDDPVYLRRVQSVIRGWYKTYLATTGAQSVIILSQHDIDLILLDIQMPIIDGLITFQMIKGEPSFQNIPIFFLSGKTDMDTVHRAAALRPEKFISKDTDASALMVEINQYFMHKKTLLTPRS